MVKFEKSNIELNIEISWATNCSIASLSEFEKEQDWDSRIATIKERIKDFLSIKEEYLKTIPPSTPKYSYAKPMFNKQGEVARDGKAEEVISEGTEQQEKELMERLK